MKSLCHVRYDVQGEKLCAIFSREKEIDRTYDKEITIDVILDIENESATSQTRYVNRHVGMEIKETTKRVTRLYEYLYA